MERPIHPRLENFHSIFKQWALLGAISPSMKSKFILDLCGNTILGSGCHIPRKSRDIIWMFAGTETNVEDDTYDFEWEQSFDTILITLDVQERGEDTNREVEINCESTKLDVRANGESLLNGTLAGAVVPSLYTYKIVENKCACFAFKLPSWP